MIKTRDLVPNIYYDNSRDFQFFGRIHEIIYNYIKTNIDIMTTLPLSKDVDLSMINLLLTTLGFSRRHEYNANDLRKICSVFTELLRLKGTRKAVELAIATLMNAQNIDKEFNVVDRTISGVKQYTFDIYLPIELKDIELLEDIFDYILPSGYEYRFYNTEYGYKSTTPIQTSSNIQHYTYSTSNLSNVAKPGERDERPEVVGSDEDLALTYTGRVYQPIIEDENSQEEENNG